MAADQFSVRLSNGTILFDESGIESYDVKTNMFTLTKPVSQKLVSNWTAFIKDAENVQLKGAFISADGASFDVLLGTRKIASGTVGASPMTLHTPRLNSIFLFGGMPLLVNGQLHLGIGKMTGDLKIMIEEGPQAAFVPVLGRDVGEHFRRIGKTTP
ncbi:MAG: hypothetical protein JNM76_02455 [Betaproteobacteria bacterium]|nr:hypothetical protein [Betaproteobacteria bacterium]